MARISGVDLPRRKRLEIGLTYIYGIGRSSAQAICDELSIDRATSTDNLTEGQIISIRKLITDKYTVEGDLRQSRRRQAHAGHLRVGEVCGLQVHSR